MTAEQYGVHTEFSRFGATWHARARVRASVRSKARSRTGPRSSSTWRRAIRSCLLVLDELHGTELTPAQWNDLVQSMVGKGLEQVRIAHVKLFGLDHIEYCELYANIAGFDARAFNNEPEAERWLRYGDAADVKPQAFQWAR